MKKTIAYTLFMVLIISGCKSQYTSEEASAMAIETHNFLLQKEFQFEAMWANPLSSSELTQLSAAGLIEPGSTGNRINLISNQNYIRVKNDSVKGTMPYFGIVRLPSTYSGTDTSIQFEGVPKNYSCVFNDKKNKSTITFEINDKSENFQVVMTVLGNKKTNVSINSSHRNIITYVGIIKAIE